MIKWQLVVVALIHWQGRMQVSKQNIYVIILKLNAKLKKKSLILSFGNTYHKCHLTRLCQLQKIVAKSDRDTSGSINLCSIA